MKKPTLYILISVCLFAGYFVSAEDSLEAWDHAGEVSQKPPVRQTQMTQDGFLWLEAENFMEYGGWKLDTQYINLMGSAYLIAPGVGSPVADATTSVTLPRPGVFRVWVRTRDWLPEYHPGRFEVHVNGLPLKPVFGEADQDAWTWVDGGVVQMLLGKNTISLHDLSGSFARCDVILFAAIQDYIPPVELKSLVAERSKMVVTSSKNQGNFDVVVVGGGSAGCPAAIAAARLGANTALIQDRPVLGGNASLELGVGAQGASISLPNAIETGIIEEATRIHRLGGYHSLTPGFHQLCDSEPSLKVFLNTRAVGVEMDGENRIARIKAVDTLTGDHSYFGARYVIDCTGDGWVGFYAGADYKLGREAKSLYNEPDAPETEDAITMSGCIMGGHSIGYRSILTDGPVDYVAPPWAAALPDLVASGRKPRNLITGEWWLEHAGTWDDLYDAERARDELIRISFGYWDYLKNRWHGKEELRNYALVYVPYLVAKRETRRLMGDHILTTEEVLNGTIFEDRISYGGWPVDIHNPDGIYKGNTPYHTNYHIREPYTIPFRSLYSRNIDNLLFAGRCASFSHFALGTVRVERTLATTGQAAGTAAALCIQKNVSPRLLAKEHIGELQQTLLKYDQYIPEVRNEDPNDLARTAHVTASSTANGLFLKKENVRLSDDRHPLEQRRAFMMPVTAGHIESVFLYLRSVRQEPVQMRLHIRGSMATDDFSSTTDLAVCEAEVKPETEGWVTFNAGVTIDTPYVWVWLEPKKGIEWRLMDSVLPGMQRAYAKKGTDGEDIWEKPNGRYACCLEPPAMAPQDYAPENVINGVSRIVGDQTNLWSPDPEAEGPHWIELEFDQPQTFNIIQLTFLTDLDTRNQYPMPRGVADYDVEIQTDTGWQKIVSETNNIQRWRRHVFEEVTSKKIRVTIHNADKIDMLGVYEIRVYRE